MFNKNLTELFKISDKVTGDIVYEDNIIIHEGATVSN